jgi:hypothetical protein
MRFKLKNNGYLEVSGIRNIVINVERDGVRTKPTTIWKRHKSGRWLKYKMSNPKKVLGGMSDVEIRAMLSMSTAVPFTRVWFSGKTCNVVTNENQFEDAVCASAARILNAFSGGLYG